MRQEYLAVLVEEYGYALEQIAEEQEVTGRGAANAYADFAIWRTIEDRREGKAPHVIMEFMILMVDPQEGEVICEPDLNELYSSDDAPSGTERMRTS